MRIWALASADEFSDDPWTRPPFRPTPAPPPLLELNHTRPMARKALSSWPVPGRASTLPPAPSDVMHLPSHPPIPSPLRIPKAAPVPNFAGSYAESAKGSLLGGAGTPETPRGGSAPPVSGAYAAVGTSESTPPLSGSMGVSSHLRLRVARRFEDAVFYDDAVGDDWT